MFEIPRDVAQRLPDPMPRLVDKVWRYEALVRRRLDKLAETGELPEDTDALTLAYFTARSLFLEASLMVGEPSFPVAPWRLTAIQIAVNSFLSDDLETKED